MRLVDNWLDEAEAYLASKSEDFIGIRQIGYAKIVSEYGNKFEGLSKNELEAERHEHRSRRQVVAEKIENCRLNFASGYLVYSVCQVLFPALMLFLAFSLLFMEDLRLAAIAVAAVDTGAILLTVALMRWCLRLLLELYEIYGAADALISLADYRGLEQIDLSRLPLTETEADTAEYYF